MNQNLNESDVCPRCGGSGEEYTTVGGCCGDPGTSIATGPCLLCHGAKTHAEEAAVDRTLDPVQKGSFSKGRMSRRP